MDEKKLKEGSQRQYLSVEFLLEEYRSIAATHDRMRGIINQMFYCEQSPGLGLQPEWNSEE